MSTMRELLVTGFGAPVDNLKLCDDAKKPEIKDNEILVQVYYATIHMGDWKVSRGDMGGMAKLMGFKPPYVPGQDYSGKVVDTGSKVTNFKSGDYVFGQVRLGNGTCSQFIVVTEQQQEIFKIPESVTMLDAACMGCTFETVYQALFRDAQFVEGETLLILGGSTVAGMSAIQMAKNHFESAKVVVTSSQKELCESLGADLVVNYKEDDWKVALKDSNFDVVLDVIGGKQSWLDCCSYNVLRQKGKYVTITGDFDQDEAISCSAICGLCCGALNRKFWSCFGERNYYMVNQSRCADIEKAAQLVVQKKVKMVVDEDAPYKLEDYLKCYEKSMARTAHGKMVIQMWDPEDMDRVESAITQEQGQVEEEEEEKHDVQ